MDQQLSPFQQVTDFSIREHLALYLSIIGLGLHGFDGGILFFLVGQLLDVLPGKPKGDPLEPLGKFLALITELLGGLLGGLLNPDVDRFKVAAVQVYLQPVTQVTDVITVVALSSAPINGVTSPAVCCAHP